MAQESKSFKSPTNWHSDFTRKPFFSDLAKLLPLQSFTDFPSLPEINRLALENGLHKFQFVDNEQCQKLNTGELYYEQFIHEKHLIPTRRNNWHDLFNALIWMLFPKTKSLLNKMHMEEILAFGVNPRTALRNRITHFDECGGILVYEDGQHLEDVQQHRWHEAFLEKRRHWFNSTRFVIFGHANYEMLLAPYIGLTGKYLPLKVGTDFHQLGLRQQYYWLDERLVEWFKQQNPFISKGSLKPLPLLGIPGWWKENESAEFYQNQAYFRPRRRQK